MRAAILGEAASYRSVGKAASARRVAPSLEERDAAGALEAACSFEDLWRLVRHGDGAVGDELRLQVRRAHERAPF